MSAVLDAPRPAAEAETTSSLLHDIIHRVDAIGVAQQRPSPVHLRTWQEIERFAEKAARSGMVPKDYMGKPDAICIAVQMGSELGLPPMQAVQNIAVINGRPAIWGDAMIALCRASPKCRTIKEWSEGEGDNTTYYCRAVRSDDPEPVTGKFSVADAKRANLWSEKPKREKQGRDGPYEVDAGPWYSYPDRMLQLRARGFALRDAFPDVLKGLGSVEEARDIPFEATGLKLPDTSISAPSNEERKMNEAPTQRDKQAAGAYGSRREEINRDIPMDAAPKPERTPDELLAGLELAMRDCGSIEAVNRLIENKYVRAMLRDYKGDHKATLDGIIAEGIGRFSGTRPLPEAPPPEESDGWPGPTPESMRREREAAGV
jgi:hypothetical protein